MKTRRDFLKLSLAAGVGLATQARFAWADHHGAMRPIMRTIPSSGEAIRAIGLGSSATFAQVARSEDVSALKEVFTALVGNGGTVFDTAPSYGASEEVAGNIARELGISDQVFWATKLNVVPRGGRDADPVAAQTQIARSFERINKRPIDLIQVHNMADIPIQLPILQELKQEGNIRYVGVTTTFAPQYEGLVEVMRTQPLDFIGVDYAIDNLTMEETIFPLAQERGIAVMVYMPFGRARLWDKVRGKEVPDWASEFGAATWAQFFLKFVLAHPAVTVATPATSRPHHMVDNLGAAMGMLPDEEMRQRMIAHIAAL